MAKPKLRCSKCKRTFSMPAHLARHVNAIHRAKRGRPPTAGRAKKVKGRVGRPKGVRSTIASRSRSGILRRGSASVIGAMRTFHNELVSQRSSLDAQIDAFARAMKTLGAAAPARTARRRPAKRGRPTASGARPGSLKDFIVRIMRQSSKPMSPRDIGTSVKKAGFKTKAKNLTKAVSNTLPSLKSVKKVGFGMYRLSR